MATEVAEWLNFLLRHIPGTIEVTPVIKRLTFESYSFPLHYGTLKAKTGAMQASQGWAALVVGWLHSFYHYGWRQIDCVKKPAATSGHCGLSSCCSGFYFLPAYLLGEALKDFIEAGLSKR